MSVWCVLHFPQYVISCTEAYNGGTTRCCFLPYCAANASLFRRGCARWKQLSRDGRATINYTAKKPLRRIDPSQEIGRNLSAIPGHRVCRGIAYKGKRRGGGWEETGSPEEV